jgi:hypothetical protein
VGNAPGAQPVSVTRAHAIARRRRTAGMPGSWQSAYTLMGFLGIPWHV